MTKPTERDRELLITIVCHTNYDEDDEALAAIVEHNAAVIAEHEATHKHVARSLLLVIDGIEAHCRNDAGLKGDDHAADGRRVRHAMNLAAEIARPTLACSLSHRMSDNGNCVTFGPTNKPSSAASPTPCSQPVRSAMGERPLEPPANVTIRYRGWECSYNRDAAYWGAESWDAYFGGADLDAPRISGKTWNALLDEIDAQELFDDR